jgi:hypothetical protein
VRVCMHNVCVCVYNKFGLSCLFICYLMMSVTKLLHELFSHVYVLRLALCNVDGPRNGVE